MAQAASVHIPENATLRARIVIEGKVRLLFYVPSSDPSQRGHTSSRAGRTVKRHRANAPIGTKSGTISGANW